VNDTAQDDANVWQKHSTSNDLMWMPNIGVMMCNTVEHIMRNTTVLQAELIYPRHFDINTFI